MPADIHPSDGVFLQYTPNSHRDSILTPVTVIPAEIIGVYFSSTRATLYAVVLPAYR